MKMLVMPCLSVLLSIVLAACSPVKSVVSNQYKLSCYSEQRFSQAPGHKTILVSPPESTSAYQTNQMLYVQEAYALNSYANNAWVSPPAEMLFPLMIQSLQDSHYFRAVLSLATDAETDYRLDTQLIELQQNFLLNPAVVQLSVKAVLTDLKNEQILVSRIFKFKVPCTAQTPYGGVLAANLASKQFTAALTQFVIQHVN